MIALGRGGQVGESRGPALFLLDSRRVADLVIAAVILLGAIVRFRKGFVMPLVAQGGALLTLAALYAGPLTGALPSGTPGLGAGVAALFAGGVVFGTVGSIVIGVVHRLSLLERFDKVLGDPAGHGNGRGVALRRARRDTRARRVARAAAREGDNRAEGGCRVGRRDASSHRTARDATPALRPRAGW